MNLLKIISRWRGKEMAKPDKKKEPEKQEETKTASQSTDIHWIKPTPPIVRDNPNDN